jgi:hypothetical protein
MPGRSGIRKRSLIAALLFATADVAIRLLWRGRQRRHIDLGTVSERWLASERGLGHGSWKDVSR